MAILSAPHAHQEVIEQGVTSASRALAPDVIRIRYSLGEDWSGSNAVFFRVLLSDSASNRIRLREVARRVKATVSKEVQPDQLGLQAYFNFRSQSEQAILKEKAWM